MSLALFHAPVFCDLNGITYPDYRACKVGLGRSRIPEEFRRDFYDRVLRPFSECRFPGCVQKVPFELTYCCACTITHYNQANKLRRGLLSLKDMPFVCVLDGFRFKKIESVGNHLRRNFNFTDAQMEHYYRVHVMRESDDQGRCRQCGSPVPFRGIGTGYDAFCFNTDCCVRWNNTHTNRATRAGIGIKKSHARGDVIPAQLGYWLKKGLTESEARAARDLWRGDNSIEGIMRRHKCRRKQAIEIRADITRKWLGNFKKMNWSAVSQKLFWEVHTRLVGRFSDIHFATYSAGMRDESKNREFRLRLPGRGYALLDFFIGDIPLLIEFDGAYWHGKAFHGKEKTDAVREASIRNAIPGIRILHVAEKDYYRDAESVVGQCLNFIRQC